MALDINLDTNHIRRFWERVLVGSTTECWFWTGAVTNEGYGHMRCGKQMVMVHRISHLLDHGFLITDLDVLHTCDHKLCVNPQHLYQGTDQDNANDRVTRDRQAKGERHGRSLITEADVLEMRHLYATGRYSQKRIGSMFGLSRSAARDAILGINWKYLNAPQN